MLTIRIHQIRVDHDNTAVAPDVGDDVTVAQSRRMLNNVPRSGHVKFNLETMRTESEPRQKLVLAAEQA